MDAGVTVRNGYLIEILSYQVSLYEYRNGYGNRTGLERRDGDVGLGNGNGLIPYYHTTPLLHT